jgi:hypothetical protein
LDDPVNSLSDRQPGEPRIRSGIGAGDQTPSRRKSGTILKTGSRFSPGTLDSCFRWNDAFHGILTFYEFIGGNKKNILKP